LEDHAASKTLLHANVQSYISQNMEIFISTTGRTSNRAPFYLHSVCLAILEGKQFKSHMSCQLMSHQD